MEERGKNSAFSLLSAACSEQARYVHVTRCMELHGATGGKLTVLTALRARASKSLLCATRNIRMQRGMQIILIKHFI